LTGLCDESDVARPAHGGQNRLLVVECFGSQDRNMLFDSSGPSRVRSRVEWPGREQEPGVGKESSRFGKSLLTSITMTGTSFRSASSTRTVTKPVLPLPVIPTTTPWVTR
jgi:hypothetical protein